MSEKDAKPQSFTIRLTLADQAALAELCDLYGLDRPASIRRAIRQPLQWKKLGSTGYFVPVGKDETAQLMIRLNKKNVYDRA